MVSTRLMSSVSVNGGASTSDGHSNTSSSGPPPSKISRYCLNVNSGASTSDGHGSSSSIGPPLAKVPRFYASFPSTSTSEAHVESKIDLGKVVSKPATNLLDLPQEVIEKIFSYLTFKNIAHLRPVSHTMDQICGSILNSTFQKLQNQMLIRFQSIKAKMPRRESARRNHPLACESDIIETLHMRLTLLQMSFGKHIERRHCCFFAGEVLDEVYRILHYIKKTTKLQRPYKVTDELFDLSSMAMEYFKEHIEPRLPEIAYFSSDFLDFTGGTFTSKTFSLDTSPLGANVIESKGDETPTHGVAVEISDPVYSEPLPQSNMVLRKRIRKIKQGMKRYNSQLSLLRQDLRSCKRKTAEQQKQIAEQQRQLAEQQKQTLEYATRLDENDKKNEETSRKFSTLLQELNKCKTELQYWRSKSPAIPPVCKGCGAVFAPVPPEDIQALVNQGVRPEGLGLIIDENTTNTLEEVAEEITNFTPPSSSEQTECNSTSKEITSPLSPQPSGNKGAVKRKAAVEEPNEVPLESSSAQPESSTTSEVRKVRRISKARTKRVKNSH